MLNASVDLLDHLGLKNDATIIRNAIDKTLNVDKVHTPDLGGQATTRDVVNNIIKEVQESVKI